ncbi:hypothetical protein niasHS_010551 [Heterodera schachtii]|uniref:Uncharacterized protein n=1 Tax=Heterodera schachtii TaxID=97005 RepID=A0ABD2IRW6_HETSC
MLPFAKIYFILFIHFSLGTLPRYLVVQPPKHGRLFLHPNTNQSVLFFTHSDVIAGRLFFHAFDTLRRVGDNVLLELRSDSVKPARMVWPIEIRPIVMASTENGRRFGVDMAINELRMGFANVRGTNLLESMVYATINSNRKQQQQMMHSDSANNKIISSSSSSPQNVQSNVINTLGDVNYAFSAPGSALLARRPSILPLSLAPTTTAPSSVSAIIPTFHASTGGKATNFGVRRGCGDRIEKCAEWDGNGGDEAEKFGAGESAAEGQQRRKAGEAEKSNEFRV